MTTVTPRRRASQRGYALLMIFLMAAIVALMLYQQLPRVAFESEREKEQLLIDRGEQYTRAIQLYYLANNRQYPTSLDDLEKREKRFLRRRFVDPFTGKDEWRIIHTNGGFLTDSLVQKPPTDSQSQSASSSFGNASGSTNTTAGANEPPQVNAAVLQRPSDRPVTPPGFGPNPFGQDPSVQGGVQGNTPLPPITLQPQPGQGALPPITLQPGGLGNQPGGLPPITLTPTPATGGQPNAGQFPPQIPGQIPGQAPVGPGQIRQTQGPAIPIPGLPGQTALPGQPTGLPGGVPGVPPGFQIDANGQLIPNPNNQVGQGQMPGAIGQPFTPQPATSGSAQGSPTAALTAINSLLTSSRATTTATTPAGGTNQIGAIAGIASTHKGPSIKVYKDQAKYELWEFVFSPTASTIPGGGTPGQGIPGQGQGQGQGGQGQVGPGQNGGNTFAPSGTFGPVGGQATQGTGRGR